MNDLPQAPVDQPTPSERIWQFVTLVSIGSLFATFGLLRLFADPNGASLVNMGLLAAQTLPLLVFVPWLLDGSARAAAVLSFVSLLYFAGAVMVIVDPAQRLAGSAELLFSITLFVGTTFFARQRGARGQASEPPASASG